MSSPLKVAIIGAGYMATEHARAFASLPDIQIAGVFSRTRDRAEKFAQTYGALVCDSVSDLFLKTKADLVVVTVVELSMAAVAEECFVHPWAVLLEKPAGYDLQDANRIRDAAVRGGSRAFVAFNRRAYSATRQAIDLLAPYSSERFIKVIDQQDQEAARQLNNQPEVVARNYMYANSIHLIDYFRVLARSEVVGVEPILKWNAAKPGVVLGKINYASGDVGLYEGIWNGPGPWIVTVNTPEQRIELRPLEQISVQLRGTRVVTKLDVDPDDTTYKPGLRYQAAQAVAAVRGKPSQLATIDDSWQSMKLVADIFGLS